MFALFSLKMSDFMSSATSQGDAVSVRKTTRTAPEVLAPAGDWEALRAAVANGADAVYFGLSNWPMWPS
jgi:hypothetical protein